MDCHNKSPEVEVGKDTLKFLLMGNPNVGKSVVFSKLTGVEVLAANYTGTTVGYTKGKVRDLKQDGILIDVPGTYGLEATSEAEEVAVNFVKEGADAIICVLDATNLERNLNFALQLKKFDIPMIFVLNLVDVAEQQGVIIDAQALEEELEAPVIPTIAVRNVGLRDLLSAMGNVEKRQKEVCYTAEKELVEEEETRWKEIGRIVEKVQTLEEREPSLTEKLGYASMQPWPGIPLAILVLALVLGFVVGGGKAIRGALLLPFVYNIYEPAMTAFIGGFITEGTVVYNVLVGDYGVLIKIIEWPFALVLPYITLFYIALSTLEDSGYLPRIGVLMDGALRKIGVQGGSIVPFIMGYGCAIPAILGSKAATTHKERVIVASLVSLAVPCTAQTAAFFVLLGDESPWMLVGVYGLSILAMILGGAVLNRMLPGKVDPMLLEIPNLLKPDVKTVLQKIKIRVKHYLVEAQIPMALGILFAAIIAETGLIHGISDFLSPVVTGWLGLPGEAGLALMLGIVRRELAVLPLLDMSLSSLQIFTGATVALFYLPCLSVLAILIKEFKLKTGLAIAATTLIGAFLIGGVINQTVRFISGIL
ncbi:FeoB small GTPase domain-containing protein [Isachenkonia alkalipeptolytica]